MPAANKRHGRSKRSPSGKNQAARTAANKLRKVARRKRQLGAAKDNSGDRWKPAVVLERTNYGWAPKGRDVKPCTLKSHAVGNLRLQGTPMRRIHIEGVARTSQPR